MGWAGFCFTPEDPVRPSLYHYDAHAALPELEIDTTYPVLTAKEGSATLTATGGTFSFDPKNRVEHLVLQPIDSRYRV